MPEDDAIQPLETGSMTVTEVTGLIHLFNGMLLAVEHRLGAKMDDTAVLATERWRKHDEELERNTKRIVTRFEKMEASILTLEQSLAEHLRIEHEEEIRTEARVKPVKNIVGWTWLHWRDIVLLFLGIVAAGTFFAERLVHFFEGLQR